LVFHTNPAIGADKATRREIVLHARAGNRAGNGSQSAHFIIILSDLFILKNNHLLYGFNQYLCSKQQSRGGVFRIHL
jgi:hypothetical protein